MATVLFAGDAFGVADVQTGVLTGYDAATTYTITINGKAVSTLGTGGTVTTTATAFAVLLNASAIPEFDEITWTTNAGSIIATANDTTHTGKTHTIVLSVSGGTGTRTDFSSTTAPTGPEGWTAENVIDSSTRARALPANADTVVFSQFDGDLKWNLDASTAATTLTINVLASFTGDTGLPFTNEDGSIDYNEYRTRYFTTDGGTLNVGAGEGDGTGMFMWNSKTSAATLNIIKTDASSSDFQHAVVWKGVNAANVATIASGSLDIAPWPGETTTVATLTVGGDAEARTSRGVTVTNVIAQDSSTSNIDSAAAITLIKIRGSATVNLFTASAVTTATLDGESPTLVFQVSAAITVSTCNLYSGSTLDLDDCQFDVTITDLVPFGPCTINDRNGRLKITNAVSRGLELITWNTTPGRAVTFSNP
jgi:hypothetical protein